MEDDTFDPNVEIERDEPRIWSKHSYEKTFSIYEALSFEEFNETLEYKTWCCLSSSWEIEIRMEKEIPFNNFNLFVCLRRIDLSPFIVEGILVIWFINIEGRKCPVSYRLEGAVDGRGAVHEVFAVDEHYRCLLRDDDYLTFPDDILIVKVQLFVRRCCELRRDPCAPVIQKQPEEEGESKMHCCSKL